MSEAVIMHIDILMALLLVASAVAAAVKWVRLPYSIALVIVGLVIGVFHILPTVEMTPELILVVFLPALLFEASWNLEITALRRNWLPISVLSTLGVVVSMAVIAALLHYCAGVPVDAALLFGAMISATDPISVLALFKKMGIDKRLSLVLEGESLFNDGTAVVLFRLILAATLARASLSVTQMVGNFFVVVLGGIVIGIIVGYAASRITRYFDDHLLEITLTGIVAYGSYLLAEQAHVSPVIAVVCAGIVLGNYGSRTAMSATTRLAVNSFWEYAAFVVNSLVFLLIGMQVKMDLLVKYAPLIGMGIVGILLARIAVVYGLCPLLSSKTAPLPWSWRHLLFWGALRGSLSMALALSLPTSFPMREAIIIVTFGVVLFTLLAQGLTIEPLVRFMGMAVIHSRLKQYQAYKSALIAEGVALHSLNTLLASNYITPRAHARLKEVSVKRQEELLKLIDELHITDASIEELEVLQTRKHLLEVKKDCLVRLVREGVVSDEVVEELKAELDRELQDLADGGITEAEERPVTSAPTQEDQQQE
ncbi:MAG TPA: Na+/H+ antiporter [Candidatus Obscuribacterales bacterium]